MNETNTVVPEPEAVTLESATNVIDFWQQRAEAAEAEAAELRTLLVKDHGVMERAGNVLDAAEEYAKTLEQQLATVTALVPEAELMERAAKYADIAQAHYLQGSTGGAIHHSHFKQKVADEETLDALADRIRARHGCGDGREERGGESDGD